MKEIVLHLHYENEQVVRNKKYKCLKRLEQMINEKPICLQQLADKMKLNSLAAKQINELINK